jgi:hypothetical protein
MQLTARLQRKNIGIIPLLRFTAQQISEADRATGVVKGAAF